MSRGREEEDEGRHVTAVCADSHEVCVSRLLSQRFEIDVDIDEKWRKKNVVRARS